MMMMMMMQYRGKQLIKAFCHLNLPERIAIAHGLIDHDMMKSIERRFVHLLSHRSHLLLLLLLLSPASVEYTRKRDITHHIKLIISIIIIMSSEGDLKPGDRVGWNWGGGR